MICREIHNEPSGCMREIGQDWQYCPTCGRLTGHVVKPDITLLVPPGEQVTRVVTLQHSGEASVSAALKLKPDVEGLAFVEGQQESVIADKWSRLQIGLSVPALTDWEGRLGQLVIESKDAPLDPAAGPWQTRKARKTVVDIFHEITTADVYPAQEIVMFRQNLSERSVEIINRGGMAANIVDLVVPPNYELVSGGPGNLPPKGRMQFKMRRRWEKDGPQNNGPLPELQFKTDDGKVVSTFLHCAQAAGVRRLPVAIIGVDLGTTATSISLRICRNNPNLDDDVGFLRPESENDNRFPTRVWVGKDGSLQFGSKATDTYYDAPGSGYVFREIKSLLRDPDVVYVHHVDFRDAAIQNAAQQFGPAWREVLVTRYLRWLYESAIVPELKRQFKTTQVPVPFVFSLPVLDYATDRKMYDQQRAKMEECIKAAGFPMDRVQFQFEPVCATLGLMYPPRDTEWPRLGVGDYPIADGDPIAVFDSGGGTTDVVLALSDVDESSAKVSLRVERCLGVDSKSQTFGGEQVTTAMIEALEKPASVEDAHLSDWATGPVNLNLVSHGTAMIEQADGDGEEKRSEEGNDLRLRDDVERLKMNLAASGSDGIALGGTTLRPVLLQKIALPHLRELNPELKTRVFDVVARGDSRYYVCVGGNTYLPVVERWVEMFMQDDLSERRLKIPEEYRQLAVAYGAVWVPDARIRNAVPYDLSVEMVHADTVTTMLELPRNSSQEIMPVMDSLELPPRGRLEFRVTATVDGHEYRVGWAEFANTFDSNAVLKTWAEVQNGALRVSYSLHDPQADTGDEEQQETANLLLSYLL